MSEEKREGSDPSSSSQPACTCSCTAASAAVSERTSAANEYSETKPFSSGADNEAFEADASDLCNDVHKGSGPELHACDIDTTENGETRSNVCGICALEKEGRASAVGTTSDHVECTVSGGVDVEDKADVASEDPGSLQKVKIVESK